MSAKTERREIQDSGSALAHHSMNSHIIHDQRDGINRMDRVPKKLQKKMEREQAIRDWEKAKYYRIALDIARALQNVDGIDWSVADREIAFLERYRILKRSINGLKSVPLGQFYSNGLTARIAGWCSLPSYQNYKPN